MDKRINAENAKEAHVLLLATIAHAKLLFGDLEGTKTDLNAAEDILNELSGVDTGVNAALYGVFAAYCKVRGLPRPPHAGYVDLRAGESRLQRILPKLVVIPCMRRCEHGYVSGGTIGAGP